MKALPLFYYPNTRLWIDDDRILLGSMVVAFSNENKILPFQSAKECLDFLDSYQSPLSKYSFLKSNTDHESYGILQRTPIDFDVTSIATLAEDSKRHDEITLMVIDYNMPGMNGFSLAQATQNLPIKKILLTGKAHEHEAIDGFNNNLIERFVQKSEPEMVGKLTNYLSELSLQYFQEITAPLLSYLEAEAQLPLSDPQFIEFFKAYCANHHIREYYLIDKQGSFLCIDEKGNRSHLIVQSDQGIEAWLSVYGDEKCLPYNELTALRERKKIPFFSIGKEAWQITPSEWPQHFYTPSILEGRNRYYWATLN